MNCKPGDIALVIGQETPSSIPVDSIVRCLSYEANSFWLDGGGDAVGVWHVEWRGRTHGSIGRFGIRDIFLRPLGNPGEHEEDQMVALMRRKQGNTQRVPS